MSKNTSGSPQGAVLGASASERYMDRALALAAKALGRTHPNPVVGCVLVKNGHIVGEGYHERAGMPHAEAVALGHAGARAKGATAYVNLEPCDHHGRTPPCTEALIRAGVKRVVIAMIDPNPIVDGSGLARLRAHGIEVVVGVREAEAQRLNEPFAKVIRTGLPYVAAKVAASLDGRIATRTGASRWITSEAAREHVHHLRNQYDAVLTSRVTATADRARLTCRIPGGRDPVRVVVDGPLTLDAKLPVLGGRGKAPVMILTAASRKRITARARELAPVTMLVARRVGRGRGVDLEAGLRAVAAQGINSVMVEAGGRLTGALLDAGLVDYVHLFLAPVIIGGHEAPSWHEGEGAGNLAAALRLTACGMRAIGPDWLIEGRVSAAKEPPGR